MTNIITQPKAFTNAYWNHINLTPTDNTTVAPDGTTTAGTWTITSAAGDVLRNTSGITVTPSTGYVFQFWAMKGTATACNYVVVDNTHSSNIVNATSYFSQLNSSTFSLISVPFTTPAGCVAVQVEPENNADVTGTIFGWNAYLCLATDNPDLAYSPVVTGSTTTGSTLTTTDGGWFHDNGSGTRTYQWQRNGSNIGGATSSTYVLATADAAASIQCVVTATNTNGTTNATSNAVTDTSLIPPQTYDGSTAWTLLG